MLQLQLQYQLASSLHDFLESLFFLRNFGLFSWYIMTISHLWAAAFWFLQRMVFVTQWNMLECVQFIKTSSSENIRQYWSSFLKDNKSLDLLKAPLNKFYENGYFQNSNHTTVICCLLSAPFPWSFTYAGLASLIIAILYMLWVCQSSTFLAYLIWYDCVRRCPQTIFVITIPHKPMVISPWAYPRISPHPYM